MMTDPKVVAYALSEIVKKLDEGNACLTVQTKSGSLHYTIPGVIAEARARLAQPRPEQVEDEAVREALIKRARLAAASEHTMYGGTAGDLYNDLADALARPAPKPAVDVPARRVRHKKRGSTYEVLHGAVMQSSHWHDTHYKVPADGRTVVVYRSEHDGSVWVRPASEFEDGRFEDIAASPAPANAAPASEREGA